MAARPHRSAKHRISWMAARPHRSAKHRKSCRAGPQGSSIPTNHSNFAIERYCGYIGMVKLNCVSQISSLTMQMSWCTNYVIITYFVTWLGFCCGGLSLAAGECIFARDCIATATTYPPQIHAKHRNPFLRMDNRCRATVGDNPSVLLCRLAMPQTISP